MDKAYLVIFCTCPDHETAHRIASVLVEEQLAACVNILPGIVSVYRWQDELQQDSELLLIIKTRNTLYSKMESRIRELHPYDVAEIIALPITKGASDYLDWIGANTGVES